jgi:hypothetical protein
MPTYRIQLDITLRADVAAFAEREIIEPLGLNPRILLEYLILDLMSPQWTHPALSLQYRPHGAFACSPAPGADLPAAFARLLNPFGPMAPYMHLVQQVRGGVFSSNIYAAAHDGRLTRWRVVVPHPEHEILQRLAANVFTSVPGRHAEDGRTLRRGSGVARLLVSALYARLGGLNAYVKRDAIAWAYALGVERARLRPGMVPMVQAAVWQQGLGVDAYPGEQFHPRMFRQAPEDLIDLPAELMWEWGFFAPRAWPMREDNRIDYASKEK